MVLVLVVAVVGVGVEETRVVEGLAVQVAEGLRWRRICVRLIQESRCECTAIRAPPAYVRSVRSLVGRTLGTGLSHWRKCTQLKNRLLKNNLLKSESVVRNSTSICRLVSFFN